MVKMKNIKNIFLSIFLFLKITLVSNFKTSYQEAQDPNIKSRHMKWLIFNQILTMPNSPLGVPEPGKLKTTFVDSRSVYSFYTSNL